MQECILYYPKNYEIDGYDIRYFKALESCGLLPLVIQDLEINPAIVLKNNYLSKEEENSLSILGETTIENTQKYYCNKCQRPVAWREILKEPKVQEYVIGYYKNDNRYLLFPFHSSRTIPDRWVRIEGRENVYYLDARTHHIFRNLFKTGQKVKGDVIAISFPDSINSLNINNENLYRFVFKYTYYEKRCPNCKNILQKRNIKEIRRNDKVVGYITEDGKIFENDYGKIISHIVKDGKKVIFIPEHLYNSAPDLFENEIDARPYKRISSAKSNLKKIARTLRNMKELSGSENDYMDSIAINYVESLKLEVMKELMNGDYDKAAKLFYNKVKIFDLFFIQGIRKFYGIPRTAINELNDLFEAFFNSNPLYIKKIGSELSEEWKNFIDLYVNVEKLKAKMKGRRHLYNSIVISTISPLPPEAEMKNILGVKELQLIQGVWHGVKFVLRPNMEKIGKYYKNYASKISFLLSKKEAKDIIKKIEAGEYYLGIEGQSLRITREMVTIIPTLPEGYQKGQFKMGEFYLLGSNDNCQNQLDDILRKINSQRHKLKMKFEDPVDIILPNNECHEYIEANSDIILRRTNARKIIFEDSFKVIPFYKSYIKKSITEYLGVDIATAESLINDGVENLYMLQVGDFISMPIRNQELKAKIIVARNRKINPIDEIDNVYCSLCGGKVENKMCEKCGFHYE
ncbi:MAG: hypothetical protein ACP5TG_00230 [Thermoplasmata archaeon]